MASRELEADPRSALDADKERKFRALVRHAHAHSRYYAGIIRDRALDVETCMPADFPVLTKSILMANFDDIVTDRRINIGTSNMTWDYFASTAGSSFNDDHPALVRTLQAVFDRDWASSYAWRLTS